MGNSLEIVVYHIIVRDENSKNQKWATMRGLSCKLSRGSQRVHNQFQ